MEKIIPISKTAGYMARGARSLRQRARLPCTLRLWRYISDAATKCLKVFEIGKWYLLFVWSIFIYQSAVQAQPLSVGAQVCFINHEQTNCVFHSPGEIAAATNIDSIVLTFNNLNIIVDNESTNILDKWGVVFSSPGQQGGTAKEFYCNQVNCAQGDVEVDANNQDISVITTGNPGAQQNHFVGTLVITLSRFKNGMLPAELQTLINSTVNGALFISATYSDKKDNADGTNPRKSDAYVWQPDLGALRNPPGLSALARSNGLVINIKPPTDLSSIQQNAVESPTTLVAADPGHVTGYLLALWLARDIDGSSPCSSTNWTFSVNPISYSYSQNGSAAGIPFLTCTYTSYSEPLVGIGGTSNLLGCSSTPTLPIAPPPAPPTPPYLQSDPDFLVLTADLVAIPKTITKSDPTGLFIKDMDYIKFLIANPAQEQAVPGACYTIVYVPASQTSYGKMGVETGQVYGYTAWTLNGAFSKEDPTPNLSLSHSNLGFMTSTTSSLASTEKDPSLKLTTADCFVATAASGDVNSKSVFYWRILRDEYLTRLGFTPFYYKHAPKWAAWLNEHPKYKPPVNFVLENTGAFFYYSALYGKQATKWTATHAKKLLSTLSDLWTQEASATENETIPPEGSVIIGQTTNFDLALTGGVLFPTADKNLYKKYYPRPTLDIELSSSAIFWITNWGWSIGGKASYGYNSQTTKVKTLGDATQKDKRSAYFGTLEVIAGARYRNVNFLYLQPGIFAGAGILRLREEDAPVGDSGQNGSGDQNQTLGITNYSPVFDFGANLDISLSTLFMYADRELALSRDILLRLTAIYRLNPSRALENTGLVVNAGFAFLF